MYLVVRPFSAHDEAEARAAHELMGATGVEFLWAFRPDEEWDHYLATVADYAAGRHLPSGHVASALLVGEADGHVVGRVSIRFELTEMLAERGGHIGYAVLPPYRRRGYATEMLLQGLRVANEHGVERVLVTCDETNVASAKVIERCGGVFDSLFEAEDATHYRRYWFSSAT